MHKILIVDDKEENIYLLQSILELNNYQTISARNGKEALEQMKDEVPDLIISDILMPIMDGFTLCVKCKTDPRLSKVPFFFYTATYTDSRDEEYALGLGADRFILKPQEPEDFLRIIDDFDAENARTLSPGKIHDDSETTVLKEYNEVLIRKIEDKMLQTEKAEKELRLYAQQLENEIKERKKQDAKLKAALEKAQESDRLKSSFLANLSHEIRTPMNGIMGFIELLDEPFIDSETQHIYMTMIKKSADRMLNTITNIVNISKIDSGQMELHLTDINLNEEMDFLFNLFDAQARQEGILLSHNNGLPDEQSMIQTDHEKFIGIMSNLINNAIKFTNEGTIDFGYTQKGDVLEFYVQDTGIGIREDKKEVIFERFRQGDDSLTRPYEGSGLGLSISKNYVEIMGGTLGFESTHNNPEGKNGTRFYFQLPFYPAGRTNEVHHQPADPLKPNKKNKKLKTLIVEDDVISGKLLEIRLSPIASDILQAKNGKEAISTCKNHSDIDLVFMDIKLPDMTGYEVTRQIRKFNKNLLIVAQTAFALEGDRDKALEAGCNDYITKPIEPDKFNLILKKYDLI
ncbi:MAG: response regulator [Bacteroidales bacterium]|nr:response regulator [Bacteroidales bacterium]